MKLKKIRNEMLTIFFVSGVCFVVMLFLSYTAINKFILKQEIQKARLVSHTLFYTREYLSKLAPYVKLTNKNINPFSLTPAHTVSMIAQVIRKKENFIIRQTSDRYRNSKNKPNGVELKAIEYFKKNPNAKELFRLYQDSDMKRYKELLYFYPLKITQKCLKCHGTKKMVPSHLYKSIIKAYGDSAFGYKVGDVRGLISVDIPLHKAQIKIDRIYLKFIFLLAIVYFIGVFLFLKIHRNILDDIKKINDHFSENTFKLLSKKLNYLEFEDMKIILNRSILSVKEYQKETHKRLFYNQLTNLPNRKKLLKELGVHSDTPITIMLIDIDRFKEFNFFYGEEIADKLVEEMAKRLNVDNLYHIKIDEFAILKKEVTKQEIYRYAQDLLQRVEEPYVIDEHEIYIKTRAGISFENRNFTDAVSALHATKILDKDIVFCYQTKEVKVEYKEHLTWLKKIKSAIEDDRIKPFYQPIVDRNRKIIKYEALVRLIEKDGKIIAPYLFLDIAKKSRLYFDITKTVIAKTFEKFRDEVYDISINLSTKDLADRDIREFILEKIREFPQSQRVNFEIIEDENIKSLQVANKFFKDLKAEGCKISIDDFGSGYANFDYLLNLNADTIKIDGSLIKNILIDKNSEIIVKTVIAFAKEANKKIVAEYVESEEIFYKLKGMGIDYFQGFYFSPPVENILKISKI